MTKAELVRQVAEKLKLPLDKAESVVDTLFDSMTAAMADGDPIELSGFGSFDVQEERNPGTGETRRLLVFEALRLK